MTKNPVSLKKLYMYLTVFTTGAVILVVEILGTRIIAPYYGTTVYVWSSLIGVTMLALTAGYFLGGYIADKRPNFDLLYGIILLSAGAVFTIPFMAPGVLTVTNNLGSRLGALASAGILFTLPLLLLGMVSPFAVKLSINELKDAGLTAGSLYGVSTIGSFIGAISTGFFLIPTFGMRAIIDIMTALLVIIAMGWFIAVKKKKIPVAILLLLLFALAVKPHADDPSYRHKTKVLFDKQTLYSKLKIVDYIGKYRGMIIDNALQTIYDRESGEYDIGYIKMFEAAALRRKNSKSVLAIGLGGGAIDKIFKKKGFSVDNVEIDPVVAETAKTYFDFDGKVIIDDGRHFVRNTKNTYDIIVLDAFNGFSIAQFLISKEAFLEMKKILNPGGMILVNTVGKLKNDGHGGLPMDRLVFAVNSTLKTVFENVRIISDTYGISNYVYAASDAAIDPEPEFIQVNLTAAGLIVTDNYNPVESMTNDIIEDWRAEEIRRIGSMFVM
jgi:spermidine synthase